MNRRRGESPGPETGASKSRPRSTPAGTLVLSVGNSSLFGGVFGRGGRMVPFRLPKADLFRLRRHVPERIERAVVCSVVPALTPDVARFIYRTWNVDAHLLTFDSSHGLELGYRRPRELGTDRIAAALGARAIHPHQDIIIVDCGTATTLTALRRDGTLLGGAILPGLSLWSEMLAGRTAQLPRVGPAAPKVALARSTSEAIASGLHFGHMGAIREILARMRTEAFGRGPCMVLGTGGHAQQFAKEKLFTTIEPNLILRGLQAFADRVKDS